MSPPSCLLVLDEAKDNVICVSDMDINRTITLPAIRQAFFDHQTTPSPDDIVVIDANVEGEGGNLLQMVKYLNELGYFIVYECKGRKSDRPARSQIYRYISLLKMNELEAQLFMDTVNQEEGVSVDKEHYLEWLAKNVGS